MYKTKKLPKSKKTTALSQEDRQNLDEFTRENRSLLQKLSKL